MLLLASMLTFRQFSISESLSQEDSFVEEKGEESTPIDINFATVNYCFTSICHINCLSSLKTRKPQISMAYHWNNPATFLRGMKKYNSMMPGKFDLVALLFYWKTIVLLNSRLDQCRWYMWEWLGQRLLSWLYWKPVDGIWEKRERLDVA